MTTPHSTMTMTMTTAMAENGEFLTNLTLDGVREGAYMLCKHSDDLLGHHARQVFREKAASMRAENSIYYYLKDLMKKFGSQQHASKIKKTAHGEPQQLVLEAHEFRKLVASDPAFESAIPSDRISTNSVEEVTLRRDNYIQLLPKLQNESSSSPMHLWFRTAAKEDGKAAISNIKYAASSRDTELVSKGFTCLQQDINRNGAFGKHKYIWTSLVPPSTQMTNEVIDLSLTSGDLSDKHTPRRSDFQRIFATNQLSFTNSELSKVIQRFDVNKDGIVDYSDFLSYITGICDASARAAGRIADAADEFRLWALEKQNKKLAKDGNIDSASAWRLLKPKHGRLDSETINHILRQRRKRLNAEQIHLLQVLMAPTTNGELKKLVGSGPVTSDIDEIYNRLNIEANGKLSLVNFAQQLNALAVEKSTRQVDLKDLVYVVQYTGANCGGDGAVLIDRFLAVIRENQDRRNMKSEFVTHYDSPQFLEGVNLLRGELKRCAKTPDGKFDYMVPFRLFDKDNSGQIVLSEFEVAIRELGVDKLNISILPDPILQRILEDIIINEQLTTENVGAYCGSIKRMFGIIDKDTTGLVPANRFVETLTEMSIAVPKADMDILVKEFASDDDAGDVQYLRFCEAISQKCQQNVEAQPRLESPPSEILSLLKTLHQQYHQAKQKLEASDVLWASGVHHPYLREELEAMMNCFQLHQNSGFNVALFKKFLFNGPSAFFAGNSGVLDNHVDRLLGELQAFLSTGKDAGTRLFSLFSELDADVSGFLSHDEFLQLLQRAGFRHFLSSEDEKLLLQFLDTNGDGAISYTEFVTFAKHADEKPKLLVENQSSISALPSPTKSVKGDEAPGSPMLAAQTPASPTQGSSVKDSSTSLQVSSPEKVDERPHAPVLNQMGTLNKLLRPPFPFAKYFSKYRVNQNEARVTVRVFEKVIDKFLDRLVIQRVVYNMKDMDIELLVQAYAVASGDGTKINYEVFLGDIAKAQEKAVATGAESDSSSSDSDDELTCSSDEEDRYSTCRSQTDAPATSPTLEPTLAKKIYRCFLAAAQHNISGRRLLEKCDVAKTGKLTLLEFQTVLRLMGCKLTDTELEMVKAALGDPKSAQINYSLLVQQMGPDCQHRPRKVRARSTEILHFDQVPDYAETLQPIPQVPSPVAASHSYRIEPAYPDLEKESTRAPLSIEEAKRIDNFVGQFFSELFNMRQIDSVTLHRKFEPYDVKCTGFVSVDAFSSVMRKLDIFLPSDVASTIISRFTAVSGEKFDYVDFCQVVATYLRPKSPSAQIHPVTRIVRDMPHFSGSEVVHPDLQFSRSDPADRVTVETASHRLRPNHSEVRSNLFSYFGDITNVFCPFRCSS
ncbi:EF-Hand 1, calcium-binding site [Phytophthora cactorum]|nr:EF-Hand 1, calcium-binding site [Phytophthora cactorum]